MALQGTLDTFALPDVLRLLSMTRKTGRLDLEGDRGAGSTWFDSGLVVAAEAAGATHRDLTESTFELLRFSWGSFSFESGATAEAPGAGMPVDEVLADAEAMLEEWLAIEAVVPSMDAWVSLRPDLPADDVTIDRDAWATVVAVGSGTTVRRLGDDTAASEISVCRAVKVLAELGVAEVTAPEAAGSEAQVTGPPAEEPVPMSLPAAWTAPPDDLIRFARPSEDTDLSEDDLDGGPAGSETADAAHTVEEAEAAAPDTDDSAGWQDPEPEVAPVDTPADADLGAWPEPAPAPAEESFGGWPPPPETAGTDTFAGWVTEPVGAVTDSEPSDAETSDGGSAEDGEDGSQSAAQAPFGAEDDDYDPADRNALLKFLSSIKN